MGHRISILVVITELASPSNKSPLQISYQLLKSDWCIQSGLGALLHVVVRPDGWGNGFGGIGVKGGVGGGRGLGVGARRRGKRGEVGGWLVI